MERLRNMARRCARLVRPLQFDRDLDQEMRLHEQLLVEEYLNKGLTWAEARREARRRFGDRRAFKEKSKQMWGFRWMEFLAYDLTYGFRHALRTLVKSPRFSCLAILTLALGIGANTAIFSVCYAVLVRPLSFPGPERIVAIRQVLRMGGDFSPGYAYIDWRERSRTVEAVAAYDHASVNHLSEAGPERVAAVQVTQRFQDVLGISLKRGRWFTPEENRPQGPLAVIVTERFWDRTFGPEIPYAGQTLRLEDSDHPIVGILHAGFRFPRSPETEILLPLKMDEYSQKHGETVDLVNVMGRLAPSVDLPAATAELTGILRQSRADFNIPGEELQVEVTRLQDRISQGVRPALLLIFAVVGFLLLIACLNAANLLLARWSARRREVWVRRTLGAGGWRLLHHYLAEGILLSASAGAIGLALAWGCLRFLLTRVPEDAGAQVLQQVQVALHPEVLLFTLSVVLAIGIVFGALPGLATGRLGGGMGSTRSVSADRRGSRSRVLLMVGEVAAALMLLVGSVLLLRSYDTLTSGDPGFEPRGVLTMALSLPRQRYPETGQRLQLLDRFIEDLDAMPGVETAALIDSLPLTEPRNLRANLRGEGSVPLNPGEHTITRGVSISPSLPLALGFRMLEGRVPEPSRGAVPEVLVNRRLSQRLWPRQSAVGKQLLGRQDVPWAKIVGVVENVRHNGPAGVVDEEMFGLYRDSSPATFAYIVVKTAGDPFDALGPARSVLRELDSQLPLFDVRSMEERAAGVVAPQRFNLFVMSLFAGLAVLLVASGLYSVLSYAVQQRTREIGVRVALGASRRTIFRLVVGRGLLLTGIGLSVGLAGAFALSRLMAGFVYGVSTTDPAAFLLAPVFLGVVAWAACWIPARRATRLDPIEVLRHE